MLNKICFILLLSAFAINGKATHASSVMNGDWSNPATWSTQQAPASVDTIFIKYYVTFSQDLVFSAPTVLIVQSGGTLCGDYALDFNAGTKWYNHGLSQIGSCNLHASAWNDGTLYIHHYMNVYAGGSGMTDTGLMEVGATFTCALPGSDGEGGSTGIEEAVIAPLTVYPDPVTDGRLTISWGGNMTITLRDLAGRKLFEAAGFDKVTIDMSPYQNGLYVLTIESRQRTYSRKILKIN